jgi:hypothetical protein
MLGVLSQFAAGDSPMEPTRTDVRFFRHRVYRRVGLFDLGYEPINRPNRFRKSLNDTRASGVCGKPCTRSKAGDRRARICHPLINSSSSTLADRNMSRLRINDSPVRSLPSAPRQPPARLSTVCCVCVGELLPTYMLSSAKGGLISEVRVLSRERQYAITSIAANRVSR